MAAFSSPMAHATSAFPKGIDMNDSPVVPEHIIEAASIQEAILRYPLEMQNQMLGTIIDGICAFRRHLVEETQENLAIIVGSNEQLSNILSLMVKNHG